MRRNVIYVKPPPKAGMFVWTFVFLWYVGIVLPLMLAWLVVKYTAISIIWIATQIGLLLAKRMAAAAAEPEESGGRHRERPHPVERLVLGKELSEELRERERASA